MVKAGGCFPSASLQVGGENLPGCDCARHFPALHLIPPRDFLAQDAARLPQQIDRRNSSILASTMLDNSCTPITLYKSFAVIFYLPCIAPRFHVFKTLDINLQIYTRIYVSKVSVLRIKALLQFIFSSNTPYLILEVRFPQRLRLSK